MKHIKRRRRIYISFKSDRSLIVINGTSTGNKIVGMYSVADGDTILIDRNCHKSVTHLMMMLDVKKLHFDSAWIPICNISSNL